MTELRDLCLRHRIRTQEVPVEKLNRLKPGSTLEKGQQIRIK